MLHARDLMTEAPVSVRPMSTVRRAVETLQTLDIRHLPVVNEENELVGMLSDRDIRALSVPYFVGAEHGGQLRTALDATVASIMTSDVLSVDAEADIAEVVDLMLDNKIGAVPVTDADGTLIGIISYIDVLRAVALEVEAAQ
jgi:acetoin utilization protein AcuB